MHPAAYRFVTGVVDKLDVSQLTVVELGSYDVNGSVRPLFAGCAGYIGVDLRPGPGVDVVGDAATWGEPEHCDVVVTTETLEHTPAAREIVANAARLLRPGGWVIVTAASPARTPHGVDGGQVGAEFYAGVSAAQLLAWLIDAGLDPEQVREADGGDVYALARKPEALR
jgi:SAM-dependent methyltransferase